MNKLHSKKIKEYRSWPKWYYHLSLDKLEKSQLFNNDEEFVCGMNAVALGQYVHKVQIVCFNLMVNHCHILGYGEGADFVHLFLFLKKRFNSQLVKDGFPPLPEDYFFKLVKVEDKQQLEIVIVYVAKNPFKACANLVPSGYIWGSTYLMFSNIRMLIDKTSVKMIGRRPMRRILHSKIRLPDEYLFNRKMGFILPESYVLRDKAEDIIGSSWKYCSDLIKNMDAQIKIAEGLGDEIRINDFELDRIVYDMLKKMFKVEKINELGNDDLCRLAVILRNKYRIEPKRIARKIHIEMSVLKQLFE